MDRSEPGQERGRWSTQRPPVSKGLRAGRHVQHYRPSALTRTRSRQWSEMGPGGWWVQTDQGLVGHANYCGPDPLSERTAAGLQVWGPGLARACCATGGQEGRGAVSEKGWSGPWGGRKDSKVEGLGGIWEAREKSGRSGVGPEKGTSEPKVSETPVRPGGRGGGLSPGALGRQLIPLCGGRRWARLGR